MVKKINRKGADARKAVFRGAVEAGDYAGITLGPMGLNGVIQTAYRAPRVTNDGVTVLRNLVLDDPTEDLGCQMVVEASMKTNERVGDATTTTAVMDSKIVKDVAALIEKDETGHDEIVEGMSARVDIVKISTDIMEAQQEVIKKIGEAARPLKKGELRKVIATSLSKAYPQHVDLITEVVDKVGKDGYIAVEENFTTKYGIDYEIHTGMRFMGSYAHAAMTAEELTPAGVKFNKRKEALMSDVDVFVTNHRIESLNLIANLAKELREKGKRKIVIIAPGYDKTFTNKVSMAIISFLQGTGDAIRILAIKAPTLTTEQFMDVAAYMGANLVNKDMGHNLEKAGFADCGHAQRVIVDEDYSLFDGGSGKVADRIKQLKVDIEAEKDPSFKEQAKRRLGTLQSGFALIRVGASTEEEKTRIKDKFEDAIHSGQLALTEDGVVKGGGSVLCDIADGMKGHIVEGALREPYARICQNAGKKIKVGPDVLDAAKSLKMAVENAFSSAAQIITTGLSIADKRRTLWDELDAKLAPRDNEDFRAEENQDMAYKT